MTENTPLMMPKDRPETAEREGSQPRATAAVLPPPRAPDSASGPGERRESRKKSWGGGISPAGSSTPPPVSDTQASRCQAAPEERGEVSDSPSPAWVRAHRKPSA